MTDRSHLLPSNSTSLEIAVAEACDSTPELGVGAAALHTFKYRLPVPESVLPWLIVEYGLGPVTPYLPDLATVIQYGVPWSRLKGTPEGVRAALQWIGYAFDSMQEAPTRRTRWHLFDLELDRFWDAETDLDTIEAVVRLSEPARSPFWRGWREYDAREFEWGESLWGDTIWGDDSGVRLHGGGVKWSFGRTHEPDGGTHEFTEGELTALGVWIEPVEDGNLTWGAFAWSTPGLKWTSGGALDIAKAIAAGLISKTYWVALKRADESVIGYRKARSVHCVDPSFQGRFHVSDTDYEPSETLSDRIYVEAMSGFGEGDGETVAAWHLVMGGALPEGAKPGVMWLPGDTLVGGIVVGDFDIAGSAVIGKTDRERFRGIFRIV